MRATRRRALASAASTFVSGSSSCDARAKQGSNTSSHVRRRVSHAVAEGSCTATQRIETTRKVQCPQK